ncbi:MAG: DUF2330 domain-containing protein [Woeseiaceae bacterium]|nr:DUF2330 domain-containing protein [Woeseiaceae bacterium]
MRLLITTAAVLATLALSATAQAFCGFYVAKADTSLFNRASQVVLVRDGDRTVLTMANDFEGDVEDFAMVIPVPTFIEREQINVGDKALIDHLDAYTAPRLVEYFDPDPCGRRERLEVFSMMAEDANAPRSLGSAREQALGVTIEASYTVGEYDILILSAEESDGLIVWLNENGYRIPDGAEEVVGSYLKQDMRFFVAKVNLEAQAESGYSYLRPLQVAYESPRFMLPIRLGTLNADGMQELYVYALTRTGRVETTNYRTVRLPSNMDLPEFVEADFSDFYRDMFARQVEEENNRAVFLEYAWDMAWCDPCAADPLSANQLRRLGVWWVGGQVPEERAMIQPVAQDVFVTRLHVRYDAEHFPEDLMFQETGDRSNFQGRYVIRHPFTGEANCDISDYELQVQERQEREAQQLANLTGWDIDEIRERIPALADLKPEEEPWWVRIWN